MRTGIFDPVINHPKYQNEVQKYSGIVNQRVMPTLNSCEGLLGKIIQQAESICHLYIDKANSFANQERAELAMFAVVIGDLSHKKATKLNCF